MKKINFTKCVAALLALLMLCILAVSCRSGENPDAEGSTADASTGDPLEDLAALLLVNSGKSDYKIIYPEGCNDYLFSAVKQLATALEDYTGAKLSHEGDFLARNDKPGDYEILIGETNRPESGQALEQLRVGGYAVQASGTKLVLCGFDHDGTVSAVDYFVRTYLSGNRELSYGKKDGSLRFTSAQNFIYSRKYPLQSITLNGTEIKDCKIVVPQNAPAELMVAGLLRDHIGTYYGYAPEIVTDELPAEDAEIRIGETVRTSLEPESGKYLIQVTQDALEIVSDTVMGYGSMVNTLLYTVFPYANPVVELTSGQKWEGTDGTEIPSAERGQIRVMYHNILGYTLDAYPVGSRSALTLQIYQEYLPDVLSLQEAATAWRNASSVLLNGLSQMGYQEVSFPVLGGNGNPIFYRSDVLELKASGYERSRLGDKGTTWCVFEVKATGKLFAVTNSHFAANSNANNDPVLGNEYRVQDAGALLTAVEKILAAHGSIPVISGGDFNSSLASDPCQTLLNGGLQSARTLAEFVSNHSARNGYPIFNDNKNDYQLGVFNSPTASDAIDHIMLSGALSDLVARRYVVLKDRISCTLSDHLPHYLDIDFV